MYDVTFQPLFSMEYVNRQIKTTNVSKNNNYFEITAVYIPLPLFFSQLNSTLLKSNRFLCNLNKEKVFISYSFLL